jgi:hypothetical protein
MHSNAAEQQERRRHDRVELSLPGRYMLRDRHEYPCATIDVSPMGVAIRGIERGSIGERIVAYISHIGRIEGSIARHFDRCFAFQVHAPASKREQLAGRIARLIQRKPLTSPEHRQHARIAPFYDEALLRTADGQDHAATLIDVSMQGAALTLEVAPPIDAQVLLGDTPTRVIRHFQGGVALAFDEELTPDACAQMAALGSR